MRKLAFYAATTAIVCIASLVGASAVDGWGLGAAIAQSFMGTGYVAVNANTSFTQVCSSGQVAGYGIGGAPVCLVNGGVVLGDGGAAFCAVTNLAALEALSVSSMVSGTPCFVNNMHARYYLDLANSLSMSSDPDSATQWSIVPTASGGSTRWVFDTGYVNPEYQQASGTLLLEIDPTSGNDAADGFSAPFQTFKRLWYAWGKVAPFFNQVTQLEWLNDQADLNDPVHLDYTLGPAGSFQMWGQLTTVQSGTITTLVSRNKAAGIPWEVTDSALAASNTWTALRWMMFKDTTLSPAGIGWVYYDNGDTSTLGTNYWETSGFTTTIANFTQPAVSSNVTVPVGFFDSSYLGGDKAGSTGLVVGSTVTLTGSNGVNGGTYTVASIPDKSHVTLTNLGTGAAPATTIPGCNTVGTGLQTGCVPRSVLTVPKQAQISNIVQAMAVNSATGTIPVATSPIAGDAYSVVRGTKVYLTDWKQKRGLMQAPAGTALTGYGSALNLWFVDTGGGSVAELHISGSPLLFAQTRFDQRAFTYDGDGHNVYFSNCAFVTPQYPINAPNNVAVNPQAPWVNLEGDVAIYAGLFLDGGIFFRGGHGTYAIGGHLEQGPRVDYDWTMTDGSFGPVDGARLTVGSVQLAGLGNYYDVQAAQGVFQGATLWGNTNYSWIFELGQDAEVVATSNTFEVINAATPSTTIGDIQMCGGATTAVQWPGTTGSANLTFINLSNSTWTSNQAWQPACNARWF